MKLNKKIVAQNLRLFGYKRFGTMKKFAEALDMNPSTLYSGYLNGRSLPGPVLLVKLIDLGCNINWLLTSRETPFVDKVQAETPRKNGTENGTIDSHQHPVARQEHRFIMEKGKLNGSFAESIS